MRPRPISASASTEPFLAFSTFSVTTCWSTSTPERTLLDTLIRAELGLAGLGLEINAGFSLAVDSNEQSPPKQVQTMGDPFVGVRYGYSVIDWFSLGMGIQGVFPSDTICSTRALRSSKLVGTV